MHYQCCCGEKNVSLKNWVFNKDHINCKYVFDIVFGRLSQLYMRFDSIILKVFYNGFNLDNSRSSYNIFSLTDITEKTYNQNIVLENAFNNYIYVEDIPEVISFLEKLKDNIVFV